MQAIKKTGAVTLPFRFASIMHKLMCHFYFAGALAALVLQFPVHYCPNFLLQFVGFGY